MKEIFLYRRVENEKNSGHYDRRNHSHEKDRETGGLIPAVSGKDLAAAVPGLAHYADVDVLEFSNKPSGWMTAADMFELSKLIDRLADTDQVDGFVITHGTDTLEETAFFLEAVLKRKNLSVSPVPCGGLRI